MPRVPVFTLAYAGTDITSDIKPLTTAIVFTDKLEGESDELEIALDNADLRWMDGWLPGEGDTLTLTMGYQTEESLGPVSFEIDEPEFQGVPDVLRLRGLATPITANLRQRNTVAYEDTTLRAIAQQIAEKHGFTLVGDVPEIQLERVTQKEQTDLEFLRETAIEYGLIFKIESASRLVFYREAELEDAAPVLTIRRQQLKSYRLRRGAKGTYKAATVSYQDPASGDFIEVTIREDGSEVEQAAEGEGEAEGEADPNAIASEDVLKVRERVENREQAELKAKEALRRANRSQIEGNLEMEGDVRLGAGLNITLQGFYKFDGKYQLTQVRHSLTKSQGYSSSAEIRRIDPIAGEQ